MKNLEIPRPQTHDLLGATIVAMGGAIERIEITDLDAGTFYATLVIRQQDGEVRVDSRPSDAIALGVAHDVPIYVAEHVIAEASQEQHGDQPPNAGPGNPGPGGEEDWS